MAGHEPSSWSEELAAELGQRALAAVGLTVTELTTLKFGTIANFKVEDPPLFLKVADPRFRSAESVLERSLQLSAWLEGNGFPVAGAAEEAAARPVAVEGAWAGIWRWQDHRHARPDPARVGQLLRRLHELLTRCPVGLPEVDHFEAARRHAVALGQQGHLEEDAVGFLLGQAERIGSGWDEFESELGVGAIHGDFEVSNVLSTDRGPVLIDLDNAQIAPREWDLVKATPGSPGGWTEEEWQGFATGYGYDVRSAPGGEVLREVRHLRSLVWMLGEPRYADRVEGGRRLLAEWIAAPQKRCSELDWAAERGSE
ncbi:MAG TPA: phosphotransferase [Solirubrobacterales bacterium]|nr:phosphotransferase [Solirubrobacterales bacterium]